MKLVHPLPPDLEIKPNRAPKTPSHGYKNFGEAFGNLNKEVRKAKVRFATLHTDVQFNASGQMIHRPAGAMNAAVLEFRWKDKKIWMCMNKYTRTADNIQELSKVFQHWRMFMQSGVKFKKEKMKEAV